MNINLTWPQTGGKFPQIILNETTGLPISSNGSASTQAIPGALNPDLQRAKGQTRSRGLSSILNLVNDQEKLARQGTGRLSTRALGEIGRRVREWVKEKRELSGRANGTIDPWYGCYLAAEAQDYALNFTLPWSACFSLLTLEIGDVEWLLRP